MSNAFVTIKMCYVYNQWYDISCATLYVRAMTEIYQFVYMLTIFNSGDALTNTDFIR